MATTCSNGLSGNILNDCAEAIGRGFKNKAWILPFSALSVTRTGNVISAFTLAAGSQGYTIDVPGVSAFNGSTIAGDDNDTMMAYTKVVRLWLGARSPQNAQHIDELSRQPHVIVLELKNQNANAEQAFVVIGSEQGAIGKAPALDAYGDALGGWTLDMTEANAPTADVFFWSGDSADATRTALNSLLTAAE